MEHNWDDLRVFLAVARDETLSAAGKRLKIDPATVGGAFRGWKSVTARHCLQNPRLVTH